MGRPPGGALEPGRFMLATGARSRVIRRKMWNICGGTATSAT